MHTIGFILEKILHIERSESILPTTCSLVMVPGQGSCSLALINQENSEMIEYAHYRHHGNESWLDDIVAVNPAILNRFQKTRIVFDTPEFILFPSSMYQFDKTEQQLNTIFGRDPDTRVFAESLSFLNIILVYRIYEQLITQIQNKFPAAELSHFILCSLKNFSTDEDLIRVFFKTDEITVQVWKNSTLQLIQQFNYQKPEDVLYYLLAICRAFNISQENVRILISGLVDNDSALFVELNKYFLNISFEEPDTGIELPDSFRQYPTHYFSPITNLVVCE